MDESAFRDAYRGVNQLPCAFEKALLTRRCGCEKAVRHNIAEREAVGCTAEAALAECESLLGLLRHNSLFALKIAHLGDFLPHAKELKVQCGGLLGIQACLIPHYADAPGVENVFELVRQATEHYGGLEALPFTEIVKHVSAFEPRRRSVPT